MLSKLQNSGNGWTFSVGVHQVTLQSAGENIIRCVWSEGAPVRRESLLVVPDPGNGSQLTADQHEDSLSFTTGRLRLDVTSSGHFTWHDARSGQLLVAEAGKTLTRRPLTVYDTNGEPPLVERVKTVDGERNFIRNMSTHTEGSTYTASLQFNWRDGEAIHGLGQGEDGIYNYRGHVQYLYQHNMRIPMPFFISSEGYGVFVDCCSLMTFRDDDYGSGLWCDAVPYLDYYMIAGDSLDEIIAGYRRLTGAAVMLPRWAFGFVQSKEAYATGGELLGVARRYRELGIPLDCVVQDWNTWEPGQWGQKTVDQARFPDLAGTLDEIHQLNVHSMVSIWPNMNAGCADHDELAENGCLLLDYSTYDAFSAKALDIYWQQAERGLFSQGFDAWWCDSTEPFSGPDWNGETRRPEAERFRLVGEEHKKYLGEERANAFALEHARGIYAHQRQAAPHKRVLNLTRSGYPGSQRSGTVLWSGDITATWPTMRRQLTEGLNFAMSGMPYWTMDAGGFFVVNEAWQKRGCGCSSNPDPIWFWQGGYNDGVDDPAYRELYVRWMQLACFLPMFRSHGTDTPREIWHYGSPGEPFYDALVKAVQLRYTLMPYIYSNAAEASMKNGTMMRSLLFDFPGDANARSIDDEFMFGRALLVCPVLEPCLFEAGAVAVNRPLVRDCYLPAGSVWYDLRTGEKYTGGCQYAISAPLDSIPVFVRGGSVLATAAGLSYADQESAEPLRLTIYPGADNMSFLYDDSGDGYGYENGEFSLIRLCWDDAAGILTLGQRAGSGFAGMSGQARLTIALGNQEKTIRYCGDEISLSFV